MNTHSLSGDSACIRCDNGQYAPPLSAVCYPDNVIGSKLRITGNISSFEPEQFKRDLAMLLDTEPIYIQLLHYAAGSVINYFYIQDPDSRDYATFTDKPTNIRSLPGNEKTLLLYQWFITEDPILDTLPFKILDLELYYDQVLPGGGLEPIQLFAAQEEQDVNPIIPTRVVVESNDPYLVPAQFYHRTVEIYAKPGNSAHSLAPSMSLLLFTIVLAFIGVLGFGAL